MSFRVNRILRYALNDTMIGKSYYDFTFAPADLTHL